MIVTDHPKCPFSGFQKHSGIIGSVVNFFKILTGPKYDGKYLHSQTNKLLGNTKLDQTLTNVVIPTFDIKNLQPTIFSSYQVISFNIQPCAFSIL